jgi:glutamate dehydrogenase/leucine dehydrogenase
MKSATDLIRMAPQDVVRFLHRERIRRFYFVYDAERRRVQSSHPQLQPVAEFIGADRRDFLAHEGLFFQVSRQHDTLQGAFVHRTCRGQAAGGVRYWHYDRFEDYLRDGLRLAKGMTHKNALAGIWWGGGKGVMAHHPAVAKADPEIRASLYREYGDLMTSLQGCYVTAEDVGTNVTDMAHVFSRTRFTTCIPASLGGSGNPSVPTARGVICGMKAALEFLGLGTLAGRTVAVQGMGNVGLPLIRFLFGQSVKKVIAADIDAALAERAQEEIAGQNLETVITKRGDLSFLSVDCDILAPCATGAVLNPQTIPHIRARVVCGAANNQLEDPERDDLLLHERGITYVPDFLTNRMGIVNCSNEQYGYVNDDPMIERHLSRDWEHSIHQTTLRVLGESRSAGEPPARAALRLADRLSQELHPIFGHRGAETIRSLVENRWHTT